MRKNKFNGIMWFLILMGFYTYICILLAKGEITYFIHPRMVKYIELSLFAIAILAANELTKLLNNKGRAKIRIGYILFLIPLSLGFIVAPSGLNTSIADKKGLSVQSYVVTSADGKSTKNYINDGKITFNDDQYVNMLNDVSGNPNTYRDKEININGFVYRDKTLKKDEFVIARFLMICCAADIQIVGLEGKWDKAQYVKTGEWIDAKGTLKYNKVYDEVAKQNVMQPVIQIESIEKIQKPDDEYIYP